MGRPVARWNGVGKYLSGFVILCFFLPFFGISCKGMDVLHVSGVDMAFGCAPGGLIMDAAEENESKHPGKHGGGGGDLKMDKIDKVDREPLAIVAFASAFVVFGAALQKRKGARALALVFTLVTLGALGGLYVMETGKLSDAVFEQSKTTKDAKGMGGAMARDIEKDIEISSGSRWGFWVVAFGMLTLAGLAGAAVKQGEDPPVSPPIPPAFAPPPTA